MVRKFSINCDFGGAKAPFDFYIGMPKDGNHPIANQTKWLGDNKGGSPPADIMDSFSKILKLSIEHNVDFEELCVHAFKEAYRMQSGSSEAQKAPQPEPIKQPAQSPPIKQELAPAPPPAPKAAVESSVQQKLTTPVKKEAPAPQVQTVTNVETKNEPKFEKMQSFEVKTEPVQTAEIQKNPDASPQPEIKSTPVYVQQNELPKTVSTPKPVSNMKKEEDEGNILDW